MENELLGIGRLASLSGLTISALRFYDGAQVLMPAVGRSGVRLSLLRSRRSCRPPGWSPICAGSACRWTTSGRCWHTPARAPGILAAHLARLEAGLADARREISIVHRLIENPEISMTSFTLSAAAFVQALLDVRYAVGSDPELPMLHGVFLDSDGDRFRVVATDRYRLATSTAPNPDRAEFAGLLPTVGGGPSHRRFHRLAT